MQKQLEEVRSGLYSILCCCQLGTLPKSNGLQSLRLGVARCTSHLKHIMSWTTAQTAHHAAHDPTPGPPDQAHRLPVGRRSRVYPALFERGRQLARRRVGGARSLLDRQTTRTGWSRSRLWARRRRESSGLCGSSRRRSTEARSSRRSGRSARRDDRAGAHDAALDGRAVRLLPVRAATRPALPAGGPGLRLAPADVGGVPGAPCLILLHRLRVLEATIAFATDTELSLYVRMTDRTGTTDQTLIWP